MLFGLDGSIQVAVVGRDFRLDSRGNRPEFLFCEEVQPKRMYFVGEPVSAGGRDRAYVVVRILELDSLDTDIVQLPVKLNCRPRKTLLKQCLDLRRRNLELQCLQRSDGRQKLQQYRQNPIEHRWPVILFTQFLS